ncbi:hypothetical protein FH972_005644 [Carpinus fangiana]|uniref:Dynamin-type G domain-containing protein n=1 Tax=Carpinus fangiana TaxID=176857 RepID=A0A5N6QPV2_9ROSI|nr:hypothetical protein FH972_005644 [Carpinus fangiana]
MNLLLRIRDNSQEYSTSSDFKDHTVCTISLSVCGQSDGKSSLLEALFGFRFNVREVEMGTRRPLILQMVHEPFALEPRCRFQYFVFMCKLQG